MRFNPDITHTVHTSLIFQCLPQIREQIKQFGINIYQFPECDSDEDEDLKKQDQTLKVGPLTISFETCHLLTVKADSFSSISLQDSIPFAVIGSNVQVEGKGRKFRGRVYPWGVVEGNKPLGSHGFDKNFSFYFNFR